MTALAMIIGMAPMALGLGEGGEQNAPLGRAVIGGLMFRHRRHPDLRAGRVQHHPSTPRHGGAPAHRGAACRLIPPRPAVSRRGLYLAGVSAAIVAVVIVVCRHYDAQGGRRQAAGMDRGAGRPGRRRRGAGCARQNRRRSAFPGGSKPTRRRRCTRASAAM